MNRELSGQTVFLVDAHSDPAILCIDGRASYLNCAPIGEFFRRMVKEGKRGVVIDFSACTGIDSTFLGILAGAALEFRKMEPKGVLQLIRLGIRNLELVRNLGLHRILDVDNGDFKMSFSESALEATEEAAANVDSILKAHQALVEANQENHQKFQDVLSFLEKQASE